MKSYIKMVHRQMLLLIYQTMIMSDVKKSPTDYEDVFPDRNDDDRKHYFDIYKVASFFVN